MPARFDDGSTDYQLLLLESLESEDADLKVHGP